MSTPDSPLPYVHWRLRDVMKERGIASVAALRRSLVGHYPFISDVQLGRIVNHLPERMNMPLLEALCHALECSPSDLMHWGTSAPTPSTTDPRDAPARATTPSPEIIDRLKGPAFSVFSRTSEKPEQ